MTSESRIDDLVADTARRYVPFWIILAGAGLGVRYAPLHPAWIHRIDRLIMVFLILSVSLALSSMLTHLIRRYAQRLNLGATTLVENLFRVVILGMGLLLILSNLGISIAPLLTALGVGSLAVALALQDTLSNLFAGIYIIVNRRIRVGDFVKVDTGDKGYVTDIGWRATLLRDLNHNIVIIPNTKLAQATVTNFHLPQRDLAVPVDIGVAYGSDLEKVERVTFEVARDIQHTVEGAVPEFEPVIRYHTFGDSAIVFTATLRAKEFFDQHLIRHEFIKRLKERYRREGIEIPFPQQVVHNIQR